MTTGSQSEAAEKRAGTATTKRSQPRKTTPKKKPSARSTAAKKAPAARAAKKAPAARAAKKPRTATVTLPFVTAEFRMPDVHAPNMHVPRPGLPSLSVPRVHVPRPPVGRAELSSAAHVVGSHMPPRDQGALYTGLGAGALIGLIDWPVAAAVAAGTFVATRARSIAGGRSRSSQRAQS